MRSIKDKLKTYTDKMIVEALLERDSTITNWFFYKKCYPLFKAAFEKYKRSFKEHGILIENEIDLIHCIYAHVMSPTKSNENSNKKCALETFGYSCTFTKWLKIVTKNYCLQLIKKEPVVTSLGKTNSDGDNYIPNEPSIDIDGFDLAFNDVTKIINMVHLPRYREILYLHYIDQLSSDEAALILGETKAAYDNALSRAKKEFNVLKEIHLR